MAPLKKITQDRVVLAVGAVGLALLLSSGEDSPIKCPVHAMTGIYCPGCGGQRAVQEIFQGDVIGAFGQNGLMFLLPALLVWAKLSEGNRVSTKILIGVSVAITILFVVARNFPNSLLAPS